MNDKLTLEQRVSSLEAALSTSEQWNVCVCGHHGSSHDARNKCMVCKCPHFGTRKSAHPVHLERSAAQPAASDADESPYGPMCQCKHREASHMSNGGRCGYCPCGMFTRVPATPVPASEAEKPEYTDRELDGCDHCGHVRYAHYSGHGHCVRPDCDCTGFSHTPAPASAEPGAAGAVDPEIDPVMALICFEYRTLDYNKNASKVLRRIARKTWGIEPGGPVEGRMLVYGLNR